MTSPALTRVLPAPGAVALAAGLAGAAATATLLVTADAGTTLLVVGAVIAVLLCCVRPERAVLAVVASFALLWPGEGQPDLLNQLPKALGALAVGAYGLRALWLGIVPRWDATYGPLLALVAAYGLAATQALDLELALDTTTRLVMFAAFYVILTQDDLNNDPRKRASRLMWTVVLSTTAAVGWALPSVLTGGSFQLSPPTADPNDFGAVVATALVLAIGLVSRSGRPAVAALCSAVLVLGLLLTLSRGSLLAALVGIAWMAVADPGLRRLLVRGAATMLVLLVPVLVVLREVLVEGLGRKANVAGDNVASRTEAWGIALDLGLQHPLVGIGPGNLGVVMHDLTHTPVEAFVVEVAHNTYLDLWVDAAVPAVLAFGALLFVVGRRLVGLTRVTGRRSRPIEVCVQAAVLTMLVASAFSTQVFNGLLWVVLALPLFVGWAGEVTRRGQESPS